MPYAFWKAEKIGGADDVLFAWLLEYGDNAFDSALIKAFICRSNPESCQRNGYPNAD